MTLGQDETKANATLWGPFDGTIPRPLPKKPDPTNADAPEAQLAPWQIALVIVLAMVAGCFVLFVSDDSPTRIGLVEHYLAPATFTPVALVMGWAAAALFWASLSATSAKGASVRTANWHPWAVVLALVVMQAIVWIALQRALGIVTVAQYAAFATPLAAAAFLGRLIRKPSARPVGDMAWRNGFADTEFADQQEAARLLGWAHAPSSPDRLSRFFATVPEIADAGLPAGADAIFRRAYEFWGVREDGRPFWLLLRHSRGNVTFGAKALKRPDILGRTSSTMDIYHAVTMYEIERHSPVRIALLVQPWLKDDRDVQVEPMQFNNAYEVRVTRDGLPAENADLPVFQALTPLAQERLTELADLHRAQVVLDGHRVFGSGLLRLAHLGPETERQRPADIGRIVQRFEALVRDIEHSLT